MGENLNCISVILRLFGEKMWKGFGRDEYYGCRMKQGCLILTKIMIHQNQRQIHTLTSSQTCGCSSYMHRVGSGRAVNRLAEAQGRSFQMGATFFKNIFNRKLTSTWESSVLRPKTTYLFAPHVSGPGTRHMCFLCILSAVVINCCCIKLRLYSYVS